VHQKSSGHCSTSTCQHSKSIIASILAFNEINLLTPTTVVKQSYFDLCYSAFTLGHVARYVAQHIKQRVLVWKHLTLSQIAKLNWLLWVM